MAERVGQLSSFVSLWCPEPRRHTGRESAYWVYAEICFLFLHPSSGCTESIRQHTHRLHVHMIVAAWTSLGRRSHSSALSLSPLSLVLVKLCKKRHLLSLLSLSVLTKRTRKATWNCQSLRVDRTLLSAEWPRRACRLPTYVTFTWITQVCSTVLPVCFVFTWKSSFRRFQLSLCLSP